MNSKQFFDEVVKMRRLQKEYFRSRTSMALTASKNQEKLIDNEIKRVLEITDKKPTQGGLFK